MVQDVDTRDVLMVAYMNAESVRRTLDSGDAWFWSRSRQELWHKGATSGAFQHVARAHTGAARIALGAGAPLVPAAISGTDRLARLGPLRVAYGEPLDLSDLDGLDMKRAAEEATDRLMARIEELQAGL